MAGDSHTTNPSQAPTTPKGSAGKVPSHGATGDASLAGGGPGATRRPGQLRALLVLYLLIQIGLVLPVLRHGSVNPVLGPYSLSYLILMTFYAAGMAGSILLLRIARRKSASGSRAFRSPGFIFATAVSWAAIFLAACVYRATDDTQFRHLAYLLFALWPLASILWTATPRAWRSLLDKLALSAAAVCVLIFFAELALHLLPLISEPIRRYRHDQLSYLAFAEDARSLEDDYQATLSSDDELGWRVNPGMHQKLDSVNGSIEGWTLTTNQWGYLDKELDLEKQYDVVAVGDSYTANGWPNLLGDQTGWDVANMGVPGYGPTQYNVTLRRHALKLHPRCVLYGLYLNDPLDCARFEQWQASGVDWFTFMGGMWFGAQTPHPGRRKLKSILLAASWLYTMGDYLAFTLQAKASQQKVGFLLRPIEFERGETQVTFDRNSFESLGNPDNPEVAHGFDIIRQRLAEAKAACDAAGTDFIVLLFPSKEWAYYDELLGAAEPEDRAAVENLAAFQARMVGACRAAGVDYLDLTDRFRNVIAEGVAPYRPIDIHWNEAGNALMAQIAREEIERRYPDLKAKEKPSTPLELDPEPNPDPSPAPSP